MAPDRESIQKKDFPTGRRGYAPKAVDAHLSWLADEFEKLRDSAPPDTDSLTAVAIEQVREILQAAEKTASEIKARAKEEARAIEAEALEIRSHADADSEGAREEAAQARDYVAKVSQAAAMMLQRVDAMEVELGTVTSNLQLLEGDIQEVKGAVAPSSLPGEPEPEQSAAEPELPEEIESGPSKAPRRKAAGRKKASPASAPEAPERESIAEAEHAGEAMQPDSNKATDGEEEAARELEAEPEPAATDGADGGDESMGARMVALNMALNGTPREVTDQYLAKYFKLDDRDTLLDEVYGNASD